MGDDKEHIALEQEMENALLHSLEKEKKGIKEETPYPKQLHIFPLVRRPFFPGMAAPIIIEPGPYLDLLKEVSKSSHKCLGLVLTLSEECDIHSCTFKDLYKVGIVARILRIIPIENGGAQVILNMERRFFLSKPIRSSKGLYSYVRYAPELVKSSKQLKAYAISIIATIKDLLKQNPLFKEELQIFLGHSNFSDPGKIADFAVALTTASREELQDVLEAFDINKRAEKALTLLKKEVDLSLLQSNINQKIEATINKSQRDFFLKEQLRTIKKELGMERDDKSIDREKFEQRLQDKIVPDHVMEVIEEELEKLSVLDMQSSEYAISRAYLDWLTLVPWGVKSEENNDLKHAKAVLEEDHYGLNDIKKRIIEIISVGKLTGGVKGNIICLVGPPGVGKTSIGRSIARALNRSFYRFSVGGMRDEAEIKGHRRTYIGAMPGKLIQALKYCKTMNPVIMLDEVDKMNSSYHGDPASALLEVLDPEQNEEFLDHYLDVRVDLSNVLFIVTANLLDTIPAPLRDRMDILRLSGYILDEKVEIAKKYLIPRNRKSMGLKAKEVTFTEGVLRKIINGYALEAGVRNLETLIKKILRKAAVKLVEWEEFRGAKRKSLPPPPYHITEKNITSYLGNPVYTSDRFYVRTPVGVATGLAWTALGGATLYIEAIKVTNEKTEMKLTGQAGQVMKESSEIAWSYLHSALHKYAPEFTFFAKTQVHMHIPEGATPKDGPSAGITMVTALISLLTGQPVLDDLGMTGELTLTGRVLPIGGVKEKLVAAKRSGLKILIFPQDNKRDIEELPDYIKKGLDIRFVEHYDEVFRIAFPELSKEG
jgi:ATP-dependent Lon protease